MAWWDVACNPRDFLKLGEDTVHWTPGNPNGRSTNFMPTAPPRATATVNGNMEMLERSLSSVELISCIKHTDDFYVVLGVSRDAPDGAIIKAYRKAALQLHPDKCPLDGAVEAFQKVGDAFACLSNPEQRASYDRMVPTPASNTTLYTPCSVDPYEMFRAFFGEDTADLEELAHNVLRPDLHARTPRKREELNPSSVNSRSGDGAGFGLQGGMQGGPADFAAVDGGAEQRDLTIDLETDVNFCAPKLRALIEDKSFFEPKADTQVWDSKLAYLLSAIGSAVGLGNIWRFPYLCYRNGGATFLIPYFISLFFLAIPLFVLEFTLGQGTGKSALGALVSLDRRLGGLGLLTGVSTCGITVYYCVILAWCMHYLVAILGALGSPLGLPWQSGKAASFYQGQVLHKTFACRNTSVVRDVAAPPPSFEESAYWDRLCVAPHTQGVWNYDESLVAISSGCTCRSSGFEEQGGLQGDTVLYLFLIYVIVFLMCMGGTKTLKGAVYVTVPLPYVLLVCIFIRGITLPGAMIGIEYYLKPDLNRLFFDYTDANGVTTSASSVWLAAASQVFFSLSLSEGVMITYASYNPPTFPVMENVLRVAFANSGTELFAGFCVFSILGYLADQRGVPIQEVVKGGPGLVFEVIPEALSLMPTKELMGILFFLMLLMLGLTSAVSLVEAGIAVLRDLLWLAIRHLEQRPQTAGGGETLELTAGGGASSGWRRTCARGLRGILVHPWQLALGMNLTLFAIGLLLCRTSGEEWVDLVDTYISNFLMTFIGVMQFVAVAWVFGMREYNALMKYRISLELSNYYTIIWRFVGPATMSLMLLAGIIGAITNPITRVPWAAALGWCIGVVPVVLCVIYFCIFDDENGVSVLSDLLTRISNTDSAPGRWATAVLKRMGKRGGEQQPYPMLDEDDQSRLGRETVKQ